MSNPLNMIEPPQQPDCPDGHGPMQREPGFWAVQGVARKGGTLLTPGNFALTSEGMVLKIWTCPVCRQAKIYADDQD